MQCPYCHLELSKDAHFCQNCGSKIMLDDDRDFNQVDIFSPGNMVSSTLINSDLRECPICGKYNAITETFRCKKCHRPWICLQHQERKFLACIECQEVDILQIIKQHNISFAEAITHNDPSLIGVTCSPTQLKRLKVEIRYWVDQFIGVKEPNITDKLFYLDCSIKKHQRSGNGISAEVEETWQRSQEVIINTCDGPNMRTFISDYLRVCKYELFYDGEWLIDQIIEIEPLKFIRSV
jgi:hypothetical protein